MSSEDMRLLNNLGTFLSEAFAIVLNMFKYIAAQLALDMSASVTFLGIIFGCSLMRPSTTPG